MPLFVASGYDEVRGSRVEGKVTNALPGHLSYIILPQLELAQLCM